MQRLQAAKIMPVLQERQIELIIAAPTGIERRLKRATIERRRVRGDPATAPSQNIALRMPRNSTARRGQISVMLLASTPSKSG